MSDVTAVTSQASYITSTSTVVFGALSISEWAAIAGVIGVIATWGLNYFVQTRRLKMDEREHRARMEKIKASCDSNQ